MENMMRILGRRIAVVGWVSLSLVVGGCATTTSAPRSDADSRAHIMELLAQTPLIDGHNDVPWAYRARVKNHLDQLDFASDLTTIERPMHTDIPRLRAGGVGAQFWSVYIPVNDTGGADGDVRTVIEQIDIARRLIDKYDDLELALTADDIERIHASGKIASLLGMEGGHSIANSLASLRAMYELGARYMTITHSKNLPWADSSTDERVIGGLTAFGREVIGEMNRLGMLVDLSHVSPETMNDALDTTEAPVIFSHSSARAVCDHPRNVPDSVLQRLGDNGGVVMVTFVPSFVSEELRQWYVARNQERDRLKSEHGDDADAVGDGLSVWENSHDRPAATLSQVADHIDHIKLVAGIGHIGIGGDFDGIDAGPVGLEDVSNYPDLFIELMKRGYSDDDLRKVAGENLLRVLNRTERVARRLQRQRPASDALIDELDGPQSQDL
jgi:membrane dipeptidase